MSFDLEFSIKYFFCDFKPILPITVFYFKYFKISFEFKLFVLIDLTLIILKI